MDGEGRRRRAGVEGEVTNDEITKRLVAYREARRAVKEAHQGVIEAAVEMGLDQQLAVNGSAVPFLDGCLVGQGIMQQWRKGGADE